MSNSSSSPPANQTASGADEHNVDDAARFSILSASRCQRKVDAKQHPKPNTMLHVLDQR